MMNSVFFFRGAVGAFNTKYFFPLNVTTKHILPAHYLAYSGCWQASVSRVRWGRTVNQRSAGKARERWHEQGGTWGLVEGLYWCVGLLLPT